MKIIVGLYSSTRVCSLVHLVILMGLTHSHHSVGGPGGSGVGLVLLIADALQQVVGDGFDLIGFDPRGTSTSRETHLNP